MRIRMAAVLAGALALVSSAGNAATKPLKDSATGVVFPPQTQVGGTSFQCLGAGVREVFVFNVYALTYCLEPQQVASVDQYVESAHPGLSGKQLSEALRDDGGFYGRLAKAPGDHLVVMKAVRDFSRQKMGEAFRESLKNVLPPEKVNELIAAIPSDVKDGDVVRIWSDGSRLTIDVAGKAQTIDDPEIAQRLWDVWLSGKSVTPSLRHSLADHAADRLSP